MLSFGLDYTEAASLWTLISLVIFLGIITYFGVPRMIVRMLDSRIGKIEADLSEARRLREEAQALMVEYEGKRKTAEADAAAMIAAARDEATRLSAEANTALEALIARRTRTVEAKIAQAESQAIAEVRARSADVAIEGSIAAWPTNGRQERRTRRSGDRRCWYADELTEVANASSCRRVLKPRS